MNLRPWLILSLAVNILLGWVVFRAGRTRAPALAQVPEVSTQAASRPSQAGFVTNKVPVVIEMAAPFHWAEIESTNYHAYIRNLRAVGCPENTVRDIVVAEVNELFSEQIGKMVDAVSGRFWELILKKEALEQIARDGEKDLDAIDQRRSEMLTALFNDSAVDDKRVADWREIDLEDEGGLFLDFLSVEKARKVTQIRDQNQAARGKLSSLPATEREQQLRQIADREREVEELLSAEEMAEYQLRTSPTAHMRYWLSDLNVSSEELKAITAAASGTDPEGIQKVLGPERYAEYQRATNSMYQGVLAVTERFDLPTETAARVYEIRWATEARAAEASRAEAYPDNNAALMKLLADLKDNAERQIAEVLGPEAFKIYKRRAGQWLGAIHEATQ